jgi:tRNA pseudouridine55 synthase
MISGILLIDKESGVTSFDALQKIRRTIGAKKAGHTGTLDSFASGLLVALVGNLTRLAPHITALKKTYTARIQFGAETDTLDPLGTIIKTAPRPYQQDFFASLARFEGVISQTPPEYSAIKIAGKRASDLRREGKTVSMAARNITVYSLGVESIAENQDGTLESADVRVCCSAGTYIRALARDIALACGSAAHLTSLRRLAVGGFSVEEAKTPAGSGVLPMTAELARRCGLCPLELFPDAAKAFFNGSAIQETWFSGDGGESAETPRAVFFEGNFSGIIRRAQNSAKSAYKYDFVCPRVLRES